jgi:hypothetical protein
MHRLAPAPLALVLVVTAVAARGVPAAEETGEPVAVRELDRQFWEAYNRCDVGGMGEHLTDDVEFYHDRGGRIAGRPAFLEALKTGLCGNSASRLRRDAVPDTVKLFPLRERGALYGAILSGEHLFYVIDQGKPPRLDGRARFTHLWILRDGGWRMSRILSYDHGDPHSSGSGRGAASAPRKPATSSTRTLRENEWKTGTGSTSIR